MKKSTFKICMLVISSVNIVLLILLCSHLKKFSVFERVSLEQFLNRLLSNDYFINIFCSIISVIGLYFIQLSYSKHKIKSDFRCNEIMLDLYDGITKTYELIEASKYADREYINSTEVNVKYSVRSKLLAEKYVRFYSENKTDFYLSNAFLTYYNNDILIDSIHTVFFININFKLLDIINNIKNRKPNVSNEYKEIQILFDEYQQDNDEKELIKLGDVIERYILDLKFLANYYKELLDYLGYDHLPNELYNDTFQLMYPTEKERMEFYKLPYAKQKKISRKITIRILWKYLKRRVTDIFK